MQYTIGKVAKMMGLTTHTLRYYDKEGLLPFVNKNHSGIRYFSEKDLDWLVVIECLKSTGLQIKEIKQYLDWCLEGASTLQKRKEVFEKQKKYVKEQITTLQKHLEKINFKLKYYEEAIKNGEEDIYERNKCLAKEKEAIFTKIK